MRRYGKTVKKKMGGKIEKRWKRQTDGQRASEWNREQRKKGNDIKTRRGVDISSQEEK